MTDLQPNIPEVVEEVPSHRALAERDLSLVAQADGKEADLVLHGDGPDRSALGLKGELGDLGLFFGNPSHTRLRLGGLFGCPNKGVEQPGHVVRGANPASGRRP